MFGCTAFYRDGSLMLVLTGEGDEPWNGVMVATDRDRHEALIAGWPALRSHPVLGKWLYISCADPAFESVATALVRLVAARDSRIGVVPKPRKPRRAKVSGPPALRRKKGIA